MSKVDTEISSSLFWHPFKASVDKEPLFVQYQRYQAQSATSSDLNFYIESPANGVLLDNEVWLHSQIVFTDPTQTDDAEAKNPVDATFSYQDADLKRHRAAWANATANEFEKGCAPFTDSYAAFRCGLPLQRASQMISLDINGTVLTYEMAKYHNAFNRLFISKEEAHTVFASSCGGGFDDGCELGLYEGYAPGIGYAIYGPNHNAHVVAGGAAQKALINLISSDRGLRGNANAAVVQSTAQHVAPYVPNSEYTWNKGFKERGDSFEYRWRVAANLATDNSYQDRSMNRYGNTVTIHVYEKLCFSPFHFYDNRDIKMSIPNIRTMQINFQFLGNAINHVMRVANTSNSLTMDWWSANPPELLCRWYTPPPGYGIPKQISLPITKIWTYTNSSLANFAITAASMITSNVVSVTNISSFNNISLPAMPDMFLIFFKRRLGDYDVCMPDDYNLRINRIQIDMEGNSGKLNNADIIHLWNMYRRHLRLYPVGRDNYENWARHHCVVPITPSDLGVVKGAGYDNPIQISISNLSLDYCFSLPSIGCHTGVRDGNAAHFQAPTFNPEQNKNGLNVNFDFHLVAIYDKYALTLTSDGSSELQLLRVNAGGTSTAPPMSGPAALADISI